MPVATRCKRSNEAPAAAPKRRRTAAPTPAATRSKQEPAAASGKGKQLVAPKRAKQERAKASGKGKQQAAARPTQAERSEQTVQINRAPVLTLWAALVAQRQGYSYEEGLSFGKWIAGVMAQSKGRSLGIYEKHERSDAEREARHRRDEAMGVQRLDVFGMKIPSVRADDGPTCAVSEGKPIKPAPVQSYLKRSFGERELAQAKEALEALAEAIPEDRIGEVCYPLYERFRPEWRGWGMKSSLDLAAIRELAQGRAWEEV